MSPLKKPIGVDVLTAARRRIATIFDRFEKVCISFSGGKDSTVLLHLAADEARRRGRTLGCLVIDLEAQYRATIDHIAACVTMYADCLDLHWVCLPINLRNAVSQYQPQWLAWDPAAQDAWVRRPPAEGATDPARYPFYRHAMEFEEFVERFAGWYAGGTSMAQLVGIRSDESLNRFRTLIRDKAMLDRLRWTTWLEGGAYNAYPIYDWRTEDIWTFAAMSRLPQNPIYDLMAKAGVKPSLQRICQPYGDDQRRGLWLFHLLEPETWPRIVARVAGANGGALYAQERGNVLGNGSVTRPAGHSWESFSRLLLASMPDASRTHYENKIAVFLAWWAIRGHPAGIPDEADRALETDRKVPSWRRICRTLLRNDYWCKGLSFSQHRSHAYDRYLAVMKTRRAKWKRL